jgi:hypothetical protein
VLLRVQNTIRDFKNVWRQLPRAVQEKFSRLELIVCALRVVHEVVEKGYQKQHFSAFCREVLVLLNLPNEIVKMRGRVECTVGRVP